MPPRNDLITGLCGSGPVISAVVEPTVSRPIRATLGVCWACRSVGHTSEAPANPPTNSRRSINRFLHWLRPWLTAHRHAVPASHRRDQVLAPDVESGECGDEPTSIR